MAVVRESPVNSSANALSSALTLSYLLGRFVSVCPNRPGFARDHAKRLANTGLFVRRAAPDSLRRLGAGAAFLSGPPIAPPSPARPHVAASAGRLPARRP